MNTERKPKTPNPRALMAEAESDLKKGRTRPVRDFLKELKRSAKIRGKAS